ncbi:MAG: CDGSH iron-sulfur domain-containing protein [Thermaerobacter sp.]|nr:iron-binding protein [Bacillota bacterium]REJ32866.1 MAG: iron-binding protein [Bacillota bacterium]
MAGATITTRDDGPLLVEGEFRLLDAQGGEFVLDRKPIALCRCGASHNKPFCDGSHKRVDFRSRPRAESETRV